MAELIPARFADLVMRLFAEPATQDTLFELPRRKWFLPRPDGPDLSVAFHGRIAGNASGPAAGPHTQMAQNILLSYVAGGRILELKTVQVDDRLAIGRPCIDMTNVGYNIEWSQELLVPDSVREYVAGAMLIEMFRACRDYTGGALDGACGEPIYDISVGYDLAGIKSEKVRRFLDDMRDAGKIVAKLRDEMPRRSVVARDHAKQYDAAMDGAKLNRLSDSVTLSTFHGCPADEIERITEFLIAEHDFDVVVKMNPPTLGQERLEHLLFDVLGYSELRVNPTAYTSVVPFVDSVQLCQRLSDFAHSHGRRVGFKFSNTLEVLNHRPFFTPDNGVMYLSGQPLHVITMTLTDEFRRAVGPHVPISFSAGIDQHNFALAAACGFVPITVSSDLLRPGGYGRLPKYLDALAREMHGVGANTVDEFILRRFGQEQEARRRASDESASQDGGGNDGAVARWAGLLNTTIVAEMARNDPRYKAERNRSVPKRVDSHLVTFDCLTCDKCLPVCPNAANFLYPTPQVAFDCHDIVIAPSGEQSTGEKRRFAIEEPMQIACYADFCNECGNCDTFCPEYGGPYIKKPSFFGSVQSWERAAPRDGFVVEREGGRTWIRGRVRGQVYELSIDAVTGERRFSDNVASAVFSDVNHGPITVTLTRQVDANHTLDMWVYHAMSHLLAGVLDPSRVNQVNAAFVETGK